MMWMAIQLLTITIAIPMAVNNGSPIPLRLVASLPGRYPFPLATFHALSSALGMTYIANSARLLLSSTKRDSPARKPPNQNDDFENQTSMTHDGNLPLNGTRDSNILFLRHMYALTSC